METINKTALKGAFATKLSTLKSDLNGKITDYELGLSKNGSAYMQADVEHPTYGNISCRVYEKSFEEILDFDNDGEPVAIIESEASFFKTAKGNWVASRKGQGGDY